MLSMKSIGFVCLLAGCAVRNEPARVQVVVPKMMEALSCTADDTSFACQVVHGAYAALKQRNISAKLGHKRFVMNGVELLVFVLVVNAQRQYYVLSWPEDAPPTDVAAKVREVTNHFEIAVRVLGVPQPCPGRADPDT